MSRSRKKNPIEWYKGHSAKQDKRMCNRICRRINKQRTEKKDETPFSIREARWKMGGFKAWGKTTRYFINSKSYRK